MRRFGLPGVCALGLLACSGGGSASQQAFCSGLGGYAERCGLGDCSDALVSDCASFAGIVNDAFLDGTTACLERNGSLGSCLLEGVRATTPSEAHMAFADAFCEGCVPIGTGGCRSAFFSDEGDSGVAGRVILPFGSAVLDRLSSECTSGAACLAFPNCAQRVIVEQGVPDEVVSCVIGGLTSGGGAAPTCAAGDGGTPPDPDGGTPPDPDGGTPPGDGGDPGCSPGLTSCGGSCVDTSRDLRHCGGCDTGCLLGESCDGGRCVASSCALEGEACATTADCCEGTCTSGACTSASCRLEGEACAATADCCAGSCVSGACAPMTCSDTDEPNDTRGAGRNLGTISDRSSFPSGTVTSALSSGTDVDWYRYTVNDDFGGRVQPRVARTAGTARLCIFYQCSGGRMGSLTCTQGTASTDGGLSGCCATGMLAELQPDCPGLNDGGEVFVRVTATGSATCESYSFQWGDD